MAPFTGRYSGDVPKRRTPAQWYCLLAGLSLLLAGLLGFIADASFETGAIPSGEVQGDLFLGFEVNGWHNLVHLASGLLLLAAANTRPTAKGVAIAFGLTYGLVALIGLIDGTDVLGILPVNAADNILHVALSALGVLAGVISPALARKARPREEAPTRTGGTVTRHLPPDAAHAQESGGHEAPPAPATRTGESGGVEPTPPPRREEH